MAETTRSKPEQHEHLIMDAAHELPEHASPAKLEAASETLRRQGEQAREVAEQAAESSAAEKNRLEQLEKTGKAPEPVHPGLISSELKHITLQRELQAIRRKLPAPERVLSRIIHQPTVRVVSEAAGKTVSRPSGLMGGGLVALLGTSGYLYFANHMGFRYNYVVFLALFAGGFVIGVILEFIVWIATRSRRQAAE